MGFRGGGGMERGKEKEKRREGEGEGEGVGVVRSGVRRVVEINNWIKGISGGV